MESTGSATVSAESMRELVDEQTSDLARQRHIITEQQDITAQQLNARQPPPYSRIKMERNWCSKSHGRGLNSSAYKPLSTRCSLESPSKYSNCKLRSDFSHLQVQFQQDYINSASP